MKQKHGVCWTDVSARQLPWKDCRTVVGETRPELVETKDNAPWENSLLLIGRWCGELRRRVTTETEGMSDCQRASQSIHHQDRMNQQRFHRCQPPTHWLLKASKSCKLQYDGSGLPNGEAFVRSGIGMKINLMVLQTLSTALGSKPLMISI